ncbi:ParB/RepB/Spo0J family partition protein [Rhizobium sp. 1399]|uniref:ParB/RepB/Spo0J family partition protein n=1 Tax=Rhizobium sp. 1399 TaxID=2817758 RepID=UPI00285F98CB|nr:ParB/RepB/Spo0J family partition protein [Rhizobium sp. 1399]MDR6671251.1 ParB family chromosome partitioning protein [Rhizobium sp. 1399]
MTEIITVPLNKLDADPKNVRKTYTVESIEGLAASILANGQLQNIVVRKAPKGRFFATAGGRRLAAFRLLAERGQIAEDHAIEAKVKHADDATEISLTENVMREAMHPADQFAAFKVLFDEGKTVSDIAARYGTTEIIVNRRLALAKVSPVLFEAYRAEQMSFEQLSAFTITDDHARQEEVWTNLPTWDKGPQTIKRQLTGEEVPASDKRVAFIGGLDAYEEAGGPVRRDLFVEDRGGFACDPALLEKLVAEKLESEAEAVRAEGWKWVEIVSQQPNNFYSMDRVYPQRVELSDEAQAKLDELASQYDELAAQIEAGPEDETAEDRLADLELQIENLRSSERVFRDEDRAYAGVFVMLDYHGRLTVSRGMVRAEDKKKQEQAASGTVGGDEEDEDDEKAATLTHSATLIEDLTAQKTAALRVEVANNSDIALVAVVHALLLSTVYRGRYGMGQAQSVMQISLTHERLEGSLKRPDENKALEDWESIGENYGHILPGDSGDLWEWLLDQCRDQLLNLLAFASAHSVNAVELKYSGDRKEAFAHADQLGQALNVKMGDYFTPTAESYFSHLNRQSIGAALAEVCGADFAAGVSSMKKADAAEYAAKSIKGTGWLPPHIRIPLAPTDEAEGAEIHPFPVAAE